MEKVIKVFLILFVLSFCGGIAKAQEQPMDIPTLEILIDFHKKKYDKLSDRALKEAAKIVVTNTTTDLSKEYEKLHKELTSRVTGYLQWVAVGTQAISLAKDVKDSFALIKVFSMQTRYLTNIYVVREYLTAIDGIKTQCTYLSATIKKIPLLRANAKEITEVLSELQSRVSAIKQYLSSCNFMVQGYVALQNMNYQQNPIDKARIASKIIREYSR